MSERQTDMYINERLAQELWTFKAAVNASGAVTYVLGWYQEIQLHFSMLVRFATIIFDIPPL